MSHKKNAKIFADFGSPLSRQGGRQFLSKNANVRQDLIRRGKRAICRVSREKDRKE